MQITCPCCHARYAVEAAIADADAREAVAIALRLPPPLAGLLLQYLGLFRPAGRSLSWSRAARLLQELHRHIHAGQLERRGRWWPAPLEAWRVALEQMVDHRERLTLPLKSHGYLYEIVVGLADKTEARAEQQVEQARQLPVQEGRAANSTETPGPVRAVDVSKRLEEMWASVGRKRPGGDEAG